MRQLYQGSRKITYALVGFILSFGLLIPALSASVASAAQVQSRGITVGTSAAGATGVNYTLFFTPQTTEASADIIVDFCSNSPLVGDTCSFNAATVPDTSSVTGTGISSKGSGTPQHTIVITGANLVNGTPYSVALGGIVNPTAVGSYYARILTFASGGSSGYLPANSSGTTPTSGSYVDYGGDALSITNNINVTSKVFETLSFCVFETACGTAPNLTLGDATTGALSTTQAYVNADAQYTLGTNAGGGVIVTMAGTTLCRAAIINATNCPHGSNANTITANTTPAALALNTEQFGMCADVQAGVGVTVASSYTDAVNNCDGLITGTYSGGSKFGFDDTVATGTNSPGGSQVLSSTGAVATYSNELAFLADIAATTEAGIYQSTLNMVATSTF